MEVESLRSRLVDRQAVFPRHQLAPELAYGRHAGPASYDAKPAAVLVLLFPDEQGQWRLLTTIRAAAMQIHAGQVCFPGGRLEAGESPEQGALREYEEELGKLPAGIEMIGRLSSVYVFISNYVITPCVAIAREVPQVQPSPAEVASVLTFPWQNLLAEDARQRLVIERFGLRFSAPCYRVEGFSIWGATAVILEDLLTVLT